MLENGIEAFKEKYQNRFIKTFPIPEGSSDELVAFSKAITSNLVGGVGYFYGDSLIDPSAAHEWDEEDDNVIEGGKGGPRLTEPHELLTATPSRSFFPRGFYWDEGFHLLHIGAWDNDLR